FYITPDLPYGTYTGATVDYSAEENAVATVTFDGNGLYFNDDEEQTTNTVKYVGGSVSAPQYSHTSNLNDAGEVIDPSNSKYPVNEKNTYVYEFPSMDMINIELAKTGSDSCSVSETENNDMFLSFWSGSHPDYTAEANYESGIQAWGNTTGKYIFGLYAKNDSIATDITGDTITLAYTTANGGTQRGCSSGYGYYAVITGYNPNAVRSGEYETPATTETEDYEFLGWSTDPNAGAATYTANDLLNPNTFTIDRSSSITLYAIWRSTTPFNISYNGNGATGSMESTESEQTETLSHSDVLLGDTANLYAPNYKKTGYGFVGWSADNDAWTHLTDNNESNDPKIYGPNQTIIVDGTIVKGIDSTTNTSTLYAVWAPAEMNGNDPVYLQNWTGCSAMTATTYEDGVLTVGKNTITALTDSRDGEVYTIAKLADGNCWMTENLRLDNSVAEGDTPTTQELSTANTNHPSLPLTNDYSAQTTSSRLSISSNNWCTSYNDPACYDQSIINTNNSDLGNTDLTASYNASGDNVQWYSYGNNYNWYSATAGNGKQETGSNVTVEGDLCPAGWQLPYGGSGDGSEGNNKGNTNGGFYYLNQQMGGNTSSTDSNNWRSFPNNFVYSGGWYGSSAGNRGYYGYYWSSTAGGTYGAYYLYFGNGVVSPGMSNGNKGNGVSVRCLAPAE
ncbi:MAG: InlB B-repeat-containing protein, partial [Prevotella sp.]|nr:InlB B-repeat-containing protein [Prevotella sp.]